jgi:prolyl-tRNA synthetase
LAVLSSQEFHVIADTGEDAIVYCPNSDYAANLEAAESLALIAARASATQAMTKVPTPEKTNCADVAKFLNIPLRKPLSLYYSPLIKKMVQQNSLCCWCAVIMN